MLINHRGDLGRHRLSKCIVLGGGGNQSALGVENGYFCTDGGCVQAGDPLQRLSVEGRRTGRVYMRCQQAGFAHQKILCLRTQRLLHDLAKGEVEHHHAQEEHHHEREEQLGEDPAHVQGLSSFRSGGCKLRSGLADFLTRGISKRAPAAPVSRAADGGRAAAM